MSGPAVVLIVAVCSCTCLLCGFAWGVLCALHGRPLAAPLGRLLLLAARVAQPAADAAPVGYRARRPAALARYE